MYYITLEFGHLEISNFVSVVCIFMPKQISHINIFFNVFIFNFMYTERSVLFFNHRN